jgi:hypothetical protein
VTTNHVDDAPAVKTIGTLPAFRVHVGSETPKAEFGNDVSNFSSCERVLVICQYWPEPDTKLAVANVGGGGVETFPPHPTSATLRKHTRGASQAARKTRDREPCPLEIGACQSVEKVIIIILL